MNYSKTIIVSASAVLLVVGSFGVTGLRVSTAHAADCGVTAMDLKQITAIQNDPTLNDSEEMQQELAVRKQLVSKTIVCAQQEVQVLQKNLQAATVQSDAQPLQAQLLGRLGEAASFYNSELVKLNGVGIAGSEAVAQEMLAWRQSTFIPLGKNVNNFILWSQNQNLFKTAATRMAQTQQAVVFLENTKPNADLQTAFNKAQSSYNDAMSENDAARTALNQNLSPDQSLALIKQSLASLSATYQNFSAVSALIKSSLTK
jgi:hypothetical protein